MLGAALVALTAALAMRAGYPRVMERRAARRRRCGASGIIEGAEPIELDRDGAPAALLLHGGGDTPQAMAGLAAHLHEHGYAVRVPLLRSHGRALPELCRASASDWYADVRKEYDALRESHESVALVGLSMGGAIAARLAGELGRDLPALVLLAPYLDMPVYARRLASSSRYWRWLFPYLPSGGGRSIHDAAAAARGLGHGVLTPAALSAFHETMLAGAAALPGIQAPTLFVQSREDNRITAASAERAFALLGAPEKRLEWIEGAGHVITVDFGHERVFALVTDWLDAYLAVSPGGRARRNSPPDHGASRRPS